MNLYEKLAEYGKSDYYPFHMPGHKRNTGLFEAGNPYEIDITEIDGFDNLHNPEEILRRKWSAPVPYLARRKPFFW